MHNKWIKYTLHPNTYIHTVCIMYKTQDNKLATF